MMIEMTASEPLSMDEEYAMQQSWRNDDKSASACVLAVYRCCRTRLNGAHTRTCAYAECTFIVLANGSDKHDVSAFTSADAIDRTCVHQSDAVHSP